MQWTASCYRTTTGTGIAGTDCIVGTGTVVTGCTVGRHWERRSCTAGVGMRPARRRSTGLLTAGLRRQSGRYTAKPTVRRTEHCTIEGPRRNRASKSRCDKVEPGTGKPNTGSGKRVTGTSTGSSNVRQPMDSPNSRGSIVGTVRSCIVAAGMVIGRHLLIQNWT